MRIKTRNLFISMVLMLLTCMSLGYVISNVPLGHADCTYCLSAFPGATTEGNTITFYFTVNGANASTFYSFIFRVKDPSSTTYQSIPQNYTTGSSQNTFTIQISYPFSGQASPGSTTLAGQYLVSVDQVLPTAATSVAATSFNIILTDNSSYERTQIVNVQASGYGNGESVNVTIKTHTTSSTVFSQIVPATSTGTILTSWKIPVNAVIDTYDVKLTGTTTIKNPADTSQFAVAIAIINIQSIASSKTSYQRTETMKFSFQAKYPDGSIATTGTGTLTLKDPVATTGISLTANYYPNTQTFNASYATQSNDVVGNWTISLNPFAYSDAYGNTGNWYTVSNNNNLQLTTATLKVLVPINTNFVYGQPDKFNATVTYPDGTPVQTGIVNAYLVYTGSPAINETVPVVYDSSLKLWVGTYTPKQSDTAGLWSLTVKASDSATPANTGQATRAITLQNSNASGNGQSLALYYWGIIGLLIGLFLAFVAMTRRRKAAANTSIKLDLDAVKSEAGRIEAGDFFKSVKGQLSKDKTESSTE